MTSDSNAVEPSADAPDGGTDGGTGAAASDGEAVAARPRRARTGTDRERPWWHRSTVYQVYPRSFADSDGDGIGDIAGITQRLDHLADLGVDVIWLSPAYRSPQDDNGYDISDYQDIDPLFGDLAAMDTLIAEAAARDIGIVMDLVVNHTSDEHPWFVESRSSRDNPKRDWYWWRDPVAGYDGHEPGEGPSGAEPTNWGSFFSGSTWAWDEATQQYYLHLFSRKQPDLNWENPEVRRAVHAMMRWWLERGVAGFRMDVINLISKRVDAAGALTDGPARPDGWGDGSPQYVDGPRMHEFLAEMHREVFDAFPGTYLTVGETPGVTVKEARRYTAPERREVDMVFQFEHVGLDHGPLGKFDPKPLHLPDLKRNFARWQKGLAKVGGWNSLYWNNHDQPRVLSRWGDDSVEHRVASAKTLGTVLHLHRGTPYVYQGEEIGMPNAGFTSLDSYRDLESLNFVADAARMGMTDDALIAGLAATSRDNARTPVAWDSSPNAGFTTGTPWIGLTPGWESVNVAAQAGDPGSVLAHYRRLVALRKGRAGREGLVADIVIDGDFELLAPDHERLWAFVRTLPVAEGDADADGGAGEVAGRSVLLVANLSSQPLDVDLAAELGEGLAGRVRAAFAARDEDDATVGPVVVASHAVAGVPDRDGRLALRPWESVAWLV
ncbi:glycoside hydrolase family 13 protein [Salana multivorans]|uniref:glycoside hydrolase family 13 protein n=1 Tax=Salana multivorans TaxID=120377 RepID=UPI000A7625F2|nr:alpha-glucosidase [Salana multivorans]